MKHDQTGRSKGVGLNILVMFALGSILFVGRSKGVGLNILVMFALGSILFVVIFRSAEPRQTGQIYNTLCC